MSAKKLTAVDLFCGVGGLSMGFQKVGFSILAANDLDKWCEETYRKNNPSVEFIPGNISCLTEERIRAVVGNQKVHVLLGGPPCQGFSTIGNRASSDPNKRNKKDMRNELFREYIRVLNILKPDYFVMENVKGMTTIQNGEFFSHVLDSFRKAGYTVDYKLINAADYGVPQVRNRVIIIGNRLGKPNKFPMQTHFPAGEGKTPYSTVGDTIGDIAEDYSIPNHIPLKHGEVNIERYKLIPEGGRLPEGKLIPRLYRKNFGNTFKRLHRDRPALTMVPGHNAFPLHPVLNRSLTPREAARIQTFPDSFTFYGPRQAQCCQVGNAVPPLLAEKIALSLKTSMEI